MQRSFMYVLAVGLLLWAAAIVPAQTEPAPAATQAAPHTGPTLAPGTVIGAELSKSIDAKKAKVGQEVTAKALGDLRDTNGNLVIPRGAKLVGHVTAVTPASKQEPQSTLAILFDKAEPKGGQEIGMHAAIQAIAGPAPSPAMQEQAPSSGGPESSGGGSPMGGSQPGMGPSGGGRTPGGPPSGGQNGQMGGGEMGGQAGQPSAPTINANSHGVIGIRNLTLAPEASPTQGSVLTSSHGNVKLESGSLLVLRVIQ
jgi:hypothetical protein